MKLSRLLPLLGALSCLSVSAGLIYSTASGSIPDRTSAGWSATATASDYLPSLTAITVNLNLSGGYTGDLYAYLSYGGVLVPLLNRVGVSSGDAFGYGDAGVNITLSSGGACDVHWYQQHSPTHDSDTGQVLGTWQPDGRKIDPLSSPASFDSASRVTFGSFDGMNPNGTWTLFIADMSAGAQSQLVSWELGITAEVPEPVNLALGIFAGLFVLIGLCRTARVRTLFSH